MPVIKRYANRKLYDTESKRYVTLEDVADFVRRGEDVRVVDHVTGEDMTSLTLLQVIFDEEKRMGVLLPQVFLTRLIRTGSDTVSALRGRLAALDPFQVVDEEIRHRIQALEEQGRISSEEARRFQDLMLRRVPQPSVEGTQIPVTEEGVSEAPEPEETASVPEEQAVDPQEIETLMRQVETLEQELRRLQNAAPPVEGNMGL